MCRKPPLWGCWTAVNTWLQHVSMVVALQCAWDVLVQFWEPRSRNCAGNEPFHDVEIGSNVGPKVMGFYPQAVQRLPFGEALSGGPHVILY